MKFIKKSFEDLKPYHSSMLQTGIILNANESPFDIPKKLRKQFVRAIKEMEFNRYPDMDNISLNAAIANAYQVKPTQVTTGVGSDELLDVIFRAVLSEEDTVFSLFPSFSMYSVFAKLNQANFKTIPFNEDFSFNKDEIIEVIHQDNPKLVVICTPNNPTGQSILKKDLKEIIEATDELVVVDLAYSEFQKENYLDLVEYDNVILLKTFSKAFSLPSMRVGFAISNAENIDMMNAVKPPYSLNIVSQTFAKIAIENKNLFDAHIAYLVQERERVIQKLSPYVVVYPSDANFIYVHMPLEVYNILIRNHIYIRKINESHFRITIGYEHENNFLIEVIKNATKKD